MEITVFKRYRSVRCERSWLAVFESSYESPYKFRVSFAVNPQSSWCSFSISLSWTGGFIPISRSGLTRTCKLHYNARIHQVGPEQTRKNWMEWSGLEFGHVRRVLAALYLSGRPVDIGRYGHITMRLWKQAPIAMVMELELPSAASVPTSVAFCLSSCSLNVLPRT